jgi:hypothetical protein
MPSLRWNTGVLALAGAVLWGQSPSTLDLRVLEGNGLVVAANSSSSRRITVEVRDAQGRPAAGARVTFRLPAEAPTGRFASGLPLESFMTSSDGKATVYGIRWSATPGIAKVLVSASLQGERSELEIPVEVSASAQPERVARAGGSSNKKWLILAGVAGGAAAALAAGRAGGSPAPGYTPPAAIVVLPSISNPSISITRP